MRTLKQLRLENYFTQEELADLFQVSSRTIQNLEKDSSNIGDKMLSKYMKAFDVKYDEIFLGNEYEIFELIEKKKLSASLKLSKKPKQTI